MKKPAEPDRVQYAEEGPFGRFVRFGRHPLRALAMGLAALALAWGIAVTEGLVAAVTGAVLGVVAGELLGRSRLRTSVLLGSAVVLGLVSWGLAALCTNGEAIPSLLGPGTSLRVSGFLRYGSLALALTVGLRVLAVRKAWALALELGFVVVAVAVMFAAHREGVIARPLWISDWAWQKGIDPADIFMTVGAVSAILLAVLLVLEQRGGRSVSTLLTLPALALLAVACLDYVGAPTPEVDDGIGLTDDEPGDPPDYDPPDDPDHSGGGDGDRDAGAGQDPRRGDGGSGGGGARDGGGGGARDGGGGGGGGDGGSGGGAGLDGGSSGAGDGGGSSGAGDGGGASGAGDGGADGGSSGAGADGGASGAGADAGTSGGPDGGGGGGAPDAGLPPPSETPPSEGGDSSGAQQTAQQQLEEQQDGPSNSPAPMAVVVLETDYAPPSETFYLRQDAWSDFNGTRLVPSEIDGSDPDTLDAFPTRRATVAAPPPADRTVVRARVAMLVEHQQPFALESPVSFQPIPNPNADRFVRAYRFESLAQVTAYQELLGREAGDEGWSEEIAAQYVETHPDPRFAELSAEILEELPEHVRDDPFAQALAIKLWLDRELIYSTRHRHADAPDPTVDFLFGNRIGYCTHFAHAAVLLWREAGVPSRIATGYAVSEENRRGGSSLLVRSGDAHAWPELYLEGAGWVVLDITAERNLDEPGQPLDEDLQRMLGEMAREQPPDPEDEIRDEEDDQGRGFPIDLWTLALILGGLVLASLYGVKLWRRVAPLFAPRTVLPRIGYRAMLDRLAEAGLAREYGESREAFAERVGAAAPAFAELTSLHVANRLRDPAAPPAARPEHSPSKWREVARATRRELRRATPLWRRLLGLLHPVSFLDSR